MSFKDILVHIDGEEAGPASHRRRDYALSLAAKLEAHLAGLVLALQPAMPPMIMGEVPGTLIESQRKASVESGVAAREAFAGAAEAAGISFESRLVECSETGAAGTFALHGRTSDLVVVGQAERDDSMAIREVLIETALFDTGRPVLIVPHSGVEAARFDRILLAWDGSREAARATHDALPLLLAAEVVELVFVGDNPPNSSQDDPAANLSSHLARHGLKLKMQQIGGSGRDVAATLLSRAADTEADLLVMGGYGHSRLREMVMGGATRGILDNMSLPVLMAH